MSVLLSVTALLLPASVTLVGYWFKRQSELRLAQEQAQSEDRLAHERQQADRRLDQQHAEEAARLRLDAAMRAARLFEGVDGAQPSTASSASGLLALTQLGHADLAVALLVDLWSSETPHEATDDGRSLPLATTPGVESPSMRVSTETAVLVINEALQREDAPNAQLVAAELLCRNATRLDPCQSLHWPSAIDGQWIPALPTRAKLLIMDGLVRMTSTSDASENALRALAARLYGVWSGDPDNPRVRGCVGTLVGSIIPALEKLKYTEFMQSQREVTLDQLRIAADSASPNPDGFLERIVHDRSTTLGTWALGCVECDFRPGRLASAIY